MLEGARSSEISTFENQNGRSMEVEGDASIIDVRVRGGKRKSVYSSHTYPYGPPHLTVLTHIWFGT
jgi:choline dehydrogenase